MDFQKTIKIRSTQQKAFEAVTLHVDKWWGNVDNDNISKIGSEFSIYFEEKTEWRFKVIELLEDQIIVWKCIFANHSFSGLKGIKEEWMNSEIKFQFKTLEDGKIELNFQHKGLTPKLNCYEICNAGWTFFVSQSLKQFLETGQGIPNLVEP